MTDAKTPTRLEELLAEAERLEAEADAAVSPTEAEEHAAIERIEAARRRKEDALRAKQRAELAIQVNAMKKAANGAYVVDAFDAEESSPGAGVYIIRSPSKDHWKVFREAVDQAAGDNAKIDRAYVNLAGSVILWPSAASAEAWLAHREKYPALVQSIGDAAGRLGGIAAQQRKR